MTLVAVPETQADLHTDVRARWRPTEEQVWAADVLLRNGAGEVFTAHVLVGKERGWWSERVTVMPVPGIFQHREQASGAANAAAQVAAEETGQPAMGGYGWHWAPGEWAVWEDPTVEHRGWS